MGWIILLLAFLFFLAVRKIPVIQFLAGLLLLVLVVSLLPGPHDAIPPWRFKQFSQMRRLKEVEGRLQRYKIDHNDELPERFSQLFPNYMVSEEVNYFFDGRAKDFQQRCKNATVDPTEVDRNGEFDYLASKVGGMLAASKTPIDGSSKFRKNLFRVIIKMDGTVCTVPEEEYQRRLAGEIPKER